MSHPENISSLTNSEDVKPFDQSCEVVSFAVVTVALTACGGGGGGDVLPTATATAPAPVPGPAPALGPAPAPAPASPFTTAEASRLIAQGGFGANRAELERVRALGSAAAWVSDQLAMPRTQGHFDWIDKTHPNGEDNRIGGAQGFVDYSVWRKFLGSPDQLRQRMVYALSQILVVGMEGIAGLNRGYSVTAYLDVLEDHAFGNFRSLLEAVTLSTAMGVYLSIKGSAQTDASGRQPDENYAREVMQLFTMGLVQLNADGTPQLQNGAPVDTYNEADVTGLARVFTGWNFLSTREGRSKPMVNKASLHETREKAFLGTTIPANTSATDSLRIALDRLFNHANVGPFIGKQLIQRLVASNPSPAYVGRVAAVFNNNGAGVRGDLAAVLQAVLLDTEARNTTASLADPNGGKLREPVLRFAAWARACNVTSPSGLWNIEDTADPAKRLGQSPMRSPSVFNFYRPGYLPPNTAIATAGKVAPEFQITTETSVAGYINFMQLAISDTQGLFKSDAKADYTQWLALASDPAALAAEANLLLAANQLGAARVMRIRETVAAMPGVTSADQLNRIYTAILLTVAAPEFLVAK